MKESILRLEKGSGNKKYTAIIQTPDGNKTRKISFGAVGYQQYKDSTGLGVWSHLDHGDSKRRKAYFSRHSAGVTNKTDAIKREVTLSGGLYNAKILSHQFLW